MAQSDMRYQLTTPTGKIMGFYIEKIARLYQSIWGGILVDTQKESGTVITIIPQDKRVA